eukprot:g6777.t2
MILRRTEGNEGRVAEAPASLVFGGGGHFLSKYTDRESKLRRRKEGDGAGAAPQPDRVNVQLNQLIVHAGTPERILQVVDENFEQLNVVNLITALHRLATVSLASRKAAVRRELRFRRLVTKLSDTVRKADPAFVSPVLHLSNARKAQDLSNVVWGLTKLGVQNGVLFNLLAERILLRLEAFKPVNLSMTLWAFARSGIYDEKLLAATSGEVKRQLKDFQPQQVANTAWAFAKCGYLFALAAEQALAELDQYQPMNFSMLVYAFALANQRHSQLFEEVAKRCWLDFGSHACSVKLEKIFHSASNARLLHLQPGDRRVILKFTDLHQEAAIMAALRRMNECWRALDIRVCGQLVQTVTYGIDPLMDAAGLVEAVADCWNLRELAQESSQRHLRILQRLPDPTSQAPSSHRMGKIGEKKSRYVFGQSPALDAPPTVVPNAVLVALGEARWKEVCIVCERALMALSTPGEFVGFACVRSVPEMALLHHQAHAYAQGLTLEGFREEEWSAARAAKNRLREVVRYVRRTEEEEPSPTPRSLAAPARSVRELRELRWLRPAEGDDEPVLFEEDEENRNGETNENDGRSFAGDSAIKKI